ncbi:MAG: hypothetical protein HYX29_01320 [Solirubrobacterales bacterium]|nr:hypothetical protein [Solirubrobacterales bacterium]
MRLVVLALLGASTLGGCGGEESKSAAPPTPAPTPVTSAATAVTTTHRQFVADLSALCRPLVSESEKIKARAGDAPTTLQVTSGLRSTLRLQRQMIEGLTQLDAPPEDRRALRSLIAVQRKMQTLQESALDALESDADTSGIGEATNRLRAKREGIIDTIGASACRT